MAKVVYNGGVRAPFNFVRISDEVHLVPWGEQISQDLPFSDGLSGEIALEIKTETPLFVGSGEEGRFVQVRGRHFIPATSIKGEVRQLLEILSFSRMSVDPRMRFARREWDAPQLYSLKNVAEQSKVRGGFLRRAGAGYEIVDCGRPYRISHEELDKELGDKAFFCKTFGEKQGVDLNMLQDGRNPKLAAYKYHLLEQCGASDKIFSSEKRFCLLPGSQRRVTFVQKGGIKGTVVFTGQPGPAKFNKASKRKGEQNAGKFYEFVFGEKTKKDPIPVSRELFDQYKFIYQRKDNAEEWNRISRELNSKKGVPVFFRKKDESEELRDFGFALLYKEVYKNRPIDILPDKHRESEGLDFAQAIFGYVADKGGKALKGRVHFSHAFAEEQTVKVMDKVSLILNSPKASFFPIYIDQDGTTQNSYDTAGARLKGWKRYHVQGGVWNNPKDDKVSESVYSTITPLKEGATFRGKVRFHNLRPVELGALLSALTFHGNEQECFHQLGQAKPYGYGLCRYDVHLNLPTSEHDATYYMGLFERMMSETMDWHKTAQVQELCLLAHEKAGQEVARYMSLKNERGENEFAQAKKDKSYLPYYSKILGTTFTVKSLISEEIKAADAEAKRIAEEARVTNYLRPWYERITEIEGKGELSQFDALQMEVQEELSKLSDNELHQALYRLSGELQGRREKAEAQLREAQLQKAHEAAKEQGVAKAIEGVKGPGPLGNKLKQYLRALGREALTDEEVEELRGVVEAFRAEDPKKWSLSALRSSFKKQIGGENTDRILGEK